MYGIFDMVILDMVTTDNQDIRDTNLSTFAFRVTWITKSVHVAGFWVYDNHDSFCKHAPTVFLRVMTPRRGETTSKWKYAYLPTGSVPSFPAAAFRPVFWFPDTTETGMAVAKGIYETIDADLRTSKESVTIRDKLGRAIPVLPMLPDDQRKNSIAKYIELWRKGKISQHWSFCVHYLAHY